MSTTPLAAPVVHAEDDVDELGWWGCGCGQWFRIRTDRDTHIATATAAPTPPVQVEDPTCLQCGQKKSRVRTESLFCCTVSGYECPEVDQEWEKHRWVDWRDSELAKAGIKPEAWDKHRRTLFDTLAWANCDDTVNGHSYATAETVAKYPDGIQVGQCSWCGHRRAPEPTGDVEETSTVSVPS